MVGQTRWVAIREKAKAALGDKFDLRGFHDTALSAGAMPIEVLAGVIDRWAAAQTACRPQAPHPPVTPHPPPPPSPPSRPPTSPPSPPSLSPSSFSFFLNLSPPLSPAPHPPT